MGTAVVLGVVFLAGLVVGESFAASTALALISAGLAMVLLLLVGRLLAVLERERRERLGDLEAMNESLNRRVGLSPEEKARIRSRLREGVAINSVLN